MNRIWLLSACLTYVAYVRCYESGINLYSFRYNTLDLDTILNSDRLVTNYVDCLLNRKPCSPEGKELKRLLPEALRTKCGKCSLQQKEGALKVLTKLYTKYPKHYNDLRERWDRTGEYHRRFLEYLREEQFNAIPNDYDRNQSQQFPIITGQVFNQMPQATSPKVPIENLSKPIQSINNEDLNLDLGNRFSEDDLSAPLQPEASAIPEASILPSNSEKMPSIMVVSGGKPSIASNVPVYIRPSQNPLTMKPAIETMTQTTSTIRPVPTSSVVFAFRLQFRPNLFYIPPNNPNGSPLIGIINRIGTKITTTADLIAEMLRGTVKTT